MQYELFVHEAIETLGLEYSRAQSRALLNRLMTKYQMPSLHHALYLQAEEPVPEDKLQALKSDIDRLLLHEPIQYLEETVNFGGLQLRVDPSVLIPRPETEELTEFIQSDFAATPSRILDIGTGSGCIAISLYKKWPDARVTAVDISAEALAVAEQNAQYNDANIEYLQVDVLTQNMPGVNWDLIVSNPPYIAYHESESMTKNVLEYEPHLALFAEGDATVFYTKIIEYAGAHLSTVGKVYFECNPLTIEQVKSHAEQHGFSLSVREDSFGRERFLKLWRD